MMLVAVAIRAKVSDTTMAEITGPTYEDCYEKLYSSHPDYDRTVSVVEGYLTGNYSFISREKAEELGLEFSQN